MVWLPFGYFRLIEICVSYNKHPWRFALQSKRYLALQTWHWKQVRSFKVCTITLVIIVAGLDFERASYETLLTSLDRIEALQAFTEKRKPVFRGE